jgi:hypothetical protein
MKGRKIGKGLYVVKDNGRMGPHHKKIVRVLDAILNVAHVELECGHTVVLGVGEGADLGARGNRVFCGECDEAAEGKK